MPFFNIYHKNRSYVVEASWCVEACRLHHGTDCSSEKKNKKKTAVYVIMNTTREDMQVEMSLVKQ